MATQKKATAKKAAAKKAPAKKPAAKKAPAKKAAAKKAPAKKNCCGSRKEGTWHQSKDDQDRYP